MKYLTLEQFQNTATEFKTLVVDKQGYINEALKFSGTIAPFYPCYPMFRVSEHKGCQYYENWNIRLMHPSLILEIRYANYNKKYFINCLSIDDLQNINQRSVEHAKKYISAPNSIGVLTAKKLLQWVNYYESLYATLKTENDTNSNEIQQFIASLDGLPVKWNIDKKGGAIIKNGLEFTFSIQQKSVSTNINFYYKTGTLLGDFLKLSDNKYIAAK